MSEGIKIENGVNVISPSNQRLQNSGDNTYTETSSTAIDVLVGGELNGDSNGGGGAIGGGGEKDNNGLTVRHHVADWQETSDSSKVYVINCERGFISKAINFAKDKYLQEMYDTSKLARIYSTYSGGEPITSTGTDSSTILLSTTSEGKVGAGEKPLSKTLHFPNISSGGSIIPGDTFVIPGVSSQNAEISANLSNQSDDFAGDFNSDNGYTPSKRLQILPANNRTLIFTGDNTNFSGKIEIGNKDTVGGTVAFGESNGTNTMDALGTYTEMVVNNKATVRLAGDDPVSIDKKWTFHGAAKLTASQRVTIASGAKMIFGAD